MADPLHQFEINTLAPIEIGGIDLSFTNSSLWMLVAIGISAGFLLSATSRGALIPNRAQMMAEMLYDFVAAMVDKNIGEKGKQYFPLVFTVFMIVLMGNLLGMIPYAFTITSHIAVTGALALMIFLLVTVMGFVKHGTHFLQLFCPPGTPLWLTPLIIPIELISYLSRPITLSVRLFINMFAGHLLLKVIAGFSVGLASLGALGFLGALAPMAFNILLIGFEIFVALIQAYVFALLSCIYLKDTVEIKH